MRKGERSYFFRLGVGLRAETEDLFFKDFGALEVFTFVELLAFIRSLERLLFIRAALFLWIVFFFAARSMNEKAFLTSFSFLLFLASLTTDSSLLRIFLFTFSFRRDPRRALFAVLVTGILVRNKKKYKIH